MDQFCNAGLVYHIVKTGMKVAVQIFAGHQLARDAAHIRHFGLPAAHAQLLIQLFFKRIGQKGKALRVKTEKRKQPPQKERDDAKRRQIEKTK